MKQQIIELKKKLLLVELPEGIVAPEKSDNICIIQDIICFRTSNMKPTLRSFGKLTDIADSQFKEWVENNYPHYCFNEGKFKIKCKTAKESFFSYLEKEGILFSNPLADYDGRGIVGFRKQFEEAESKVWQLSQTYLFQILN